MNESPAGYPTQTAPAWQGWSQNRVPSRLSGWSYATRRAANPAEELLSDAVGWWDVANYREGDRWLRNRGTAQDLLDFRLGSSTTTNTNDPLRVPTAEVGYVYLPGVTNNSVSCTAPATATQFSAYPLDGSAPTTGAATGGAAFTFSTVGSWTQVDLLDAGNTVVASLNADALTTAAATSYTDVYSVVWAINRETAAAGRKTVVMPSRSVGGRSVFLLGTDDYLEVPIENRYQNQLVAVRQAEPFTALIVYRAWFINNSNVIIFSKGNGNSGSVGPRWFFRFTTDRMTIGTDSTEGGLAQANAPGPQNLGQAYVGAWVNTDRTCTAYLNTTSTAPLSRAAIGSSYNVTDPLRVGPRDQEFYAAAFFRRALTVAELDAICRYYGTI